MSVAPQLIADPVDWGDPFDWGAPGLLWGAAMYVTTSDFHLLATGVEVPMLVAVGLDEDAELISVGLDETPHLTQVGL
jgi:hypothetical protein